MWLAISEKFSILFGWKSKEKPPVTLDWNGQSVKLMWLGPHSLIFRRGIVRGKARAFLPLSTSSRMFIFVKFLISENHTILTSVEKRANVANSFGNPFNRFPGVLYLAIECEIANFYFCLHEVVFCCCLWRGDSRWERFWPKSLKVTHVIRILVDFLKCLSSSFASFLYFAKYIFHSSNHSRYWLEQIYSNPVHMAHESISAVFFKTRFKSFPQLDSLCFS